MADSQWVLDDPVVDRADGIVMALGATVAPCIGRSAVTVIHRRASSDHGRATKMLASTDASIAGLTRGGHYGRAVVVAAVVTLISRCGSSDHRGRLQNAFLPRWRRVGLLETTLGLKGRRQRACAAVTVILVGDSGGRRAASSTEGVLAVTSREVVRLEGVRWTGSRVCCLPVKFL